ncbi:MAG: type II secretion system F family protein [bacterium]|nr:type II secretion system F family protein [bacterium]
MQFHYKALNKDGLMVVGLVQAPSRFHAEEKIKSNGLELIGIKATKGILSKLNKKLNITGINAWDRSSIYRELATMIKAGMPLMRGLRLISKHDNPKIQKIFNNIIKDVEEGKSFSSACAKQPQFFNNIDTHIIESGETTGSFDRVLFKLAESKEKEYLLKEKIKSAMAYPIIVIFIVIAVVFIMMTKIVPVFEDVFEGANQKLPLATRVLIGISNFTVDFWWLMLLFLAALITCSILYVRYTTIGKYLWSLIKIKTPLFGHIHRSVVLAEISNTLSVMISSGVDIVETIKLAGNVANNEIFRRCFNNIALNLEKGVPISASMEAYNLIFPPIVIDMIAVGEESGTTDQMLLTLAHYYEEDADTKVKTLSSSLEPMLIALLGLGVAFVVFAVMMPIVNLSNVI